MSYSNEFEGKTTYPELNYMLVNIKKYFDNDENLSFDWFERTIIPVFTTPNKYGCRRDAEMINVLGDLINHITYQFDEFESSLTAHDRFYIKTFAYFIAQIATGDI
ncbi:TPA: hypothetical protein SMW33_004502 [Pseudomonas aeruginosa]|nr:hypothetical protein [Pseudomonas aeruginosa]HEK3577554.1 hypothetical protein [Pseudomonas aeruginosa]HEK3590443.1 hypothetical protein [Pseudomonas aeruginosa]